MIISKKILDEVAESHYLLGVKNPGRCEGCKRDVEYIVQTPSCTKYCWDGQGEDPNRDRMLCITCSEDHLDYWNEMWSDYYSSVL